MRRIIIFIVSLYLFTPFVIAQSPTLVKLDGETISFEALKGKWVFINYWASWCQPCLDEIKHLNRFYRTNQADVALFAVNFDSLPIEQQAQITKQLGLTYPSLARDPGPALGLSSVRGVPATFVFNPEGRLVDTLYGGQTVKSLTEALIPQAPNRH